MVERRCANPYWQHFSGERYFRHELPCDLSSLVRWRQRIGEEGCEWLLAHSIEAATRAGVIKRRSLDEVVLDTTVQTKAIAHPTDSRLLNRAREHLVGVAQDAGNPCDVHTVDSQLEQVGILTGHTPKIVLADRGYRGVQPPSGTRLLISHTR